MLTGLRWMVSGWVACVVLLAPAGAAGGDAEAWLVAVEQARGAGRAVLPEEDAAGAVDGVIDGGLSFHTAEDDGPWWQVDLGSVRTVSRVVIYNANSCPERAARLLLLLSDDGGRWREVYQHDGSTFWGAKDNKPLVVPLDGGDQGQFQPARFVRIRLPGRNWLHLDEVQVLDAAGKENLALGKPATQSSASRWSTRSIRVPAKGDWKSDVRLGRRTIEAVLRDAGAARSAIRSELDVLCRENVLLDDPRWAGLFDRAGELRRRFRSARERLTQFNPRAMRAAIEDLATSFPGRYGEAARYLDRVEHYEKRLPGLREALAAGEPGALDEAGELADFQRQAMLANPLLDFDRLVVLRRELGGNARRAMGASLGVGTLNSHTNDSLPRTGWDNQVALLSDLDGRAELATLYKPPGGEIVADLEVDFDAEHVLFSSVGRTQQNWRVFEIGVDGTGLVQVTPDDGPDVAHFDACYLPDGRIIFASTATYQGLPCEFGGRAMVCLYRLDRRTGGVRQLTFEQDSDWCPTVTPGGRVMYLRWEYADLPHANSRILFHMNPDGTGQMEFYGSGSYFTPSLFYARSVPGHATRAIGVAGGHHGTPRSGRLLVVDPALGRREAEGVVQEIPGHGQPVEPIVRDRLVDGVWPHFLHPCPLSEKYFLVSMKWGPDSLWGVYLVDVFDNITLVKELEGAALLDPIPLRPTPRPPVIADKVDPGRRDATVYLVDIYRGKGLEGIPRGTVKRLRLVSYYFSSRGMGGLLGSIGMDGPWDIKRVLGSVPVEPDGSALFSVPANTPISVQPLDAEGKAVQLMRSWLVAMPGETVSCVGCHESQNGVTPSRQTQAARRAPSRIESWRGPTRGFAFAREVQPVLDKFCVGCHHGRPQDDGTVIADLRGTRQITDWSSQISGHVNAKFGGRFSASYAELHRFVRRPGIESDLHMLTPGEFHADTTELVQMLRAGHHGVRLDEEAWDRVVTWIDLNAPYHGTWSEIVGPEAVGRVMPRRRQLSRLYAGIYVDYEAIAQPAQGSGQPIVPPPQTSTPAAKPAAGPAVVKGLDWPFHAQQARRRQGPPERAVVGVDLGDGVELKLVRIPAGEFVTGQAGEYPHRHPRQRPPTVEIDRPFWMGQLEVTNRQYARFDPVHDSRHESRHGYQFGRLGYPVNRPEQPVVRVSFDEAMAFCGWLGRRTGLHFTLPSQQQWEWACRAGTDTPFYFGDLDGDFSPWANLGDRRLSEFAACTARGGYTRAEVIDAAGAYDDWVPRDGRFDDGAFLSVAPGGYRPNAWGLHDMHGNVWEWTRSRRHGRHVVRGGSWYDRPKRCTSSFSLDYHPYQKVFNVGFRVVLEENGVGSHFRLEKEAQPLYHSSGTKMSPDPIFRRFDPSGHRGDRPALACAL